MPELSQIGGAVKILDKSLPEPIILARVEDKEYVALSLKCPHRGVELEYLKKDKQFRCASLGHSRFKTNGAYIKGPAKKPLKSYSTRLGILDRNKLVIIID